MKIVVAPDKFKNSLSAAQAGEAIAKGLRRVGAELEIVTVPMADGGEGTVEALVGATKGQLCRVQVCGPLGETVEADYGILGGGEGSKTTAVIEMAAAAGLYLVPPKKRNPLKTTTFGVGELIRDGLQQGCRNFIIGIGGSATNDCGTGMAQALGIKFFDQAGEEITRAMAGELLGEVANLDISGLAAELKGCTFTVASDVKNPLLGPQGASQVYARQKGANDRDIAVLEGNMSNIIGRIEAVLGKKVRDIPGAGAAGGIGAGLVSFLGARIEPGIDIVIRYSKFQEIISSADLIITGEGQIDGSTVAGKTIAGIAEAASKCSVPVICLGGSLGEDYQRVMELEAVKAVFSICPGPISLDQALKEGGELLADTAEQVLRLALALPGKNTY